MKKVFIIHGFEAWPNGGWRPWLMGELYNNRIFSVSLEMPNPKFPKMNEWVSKIKEEVKNPSNDKYLIGHSLGVPAILRYLETLKDNEKIGGVILVSGPFGKLDKDNHSSRARLMDDFFDKEFDFDHIKKVCNKFYIIHNTFDKVVPFVNAELFSKNLDIPIIKIERENDGHLGDEPFCNKLPEILDLILKNI